MECDNDVSKGKREGKIKGTEGGYSRDDRTKSVEQSQN